MKKQLLLLAVVAMFAGVASDISATRGNKKGQSTNAAVKKEHKKGGKRCGKDGKCGKRGKYGKRTEQAQSSE